MTQVNTDNQYKYTKKFGNVVMYSNDNVFWTSEPEVNTVTNDDELRKEIEHYLTLNMPIHGEHAIDKRNILQAIMPIIAADRAKAVLDGQIAELLLVERDDNYNHTLSLTGRERLIKRLHELQTKRKAL